MDQASPRVGEERSVPRASADPARPACREPAPEAFDRGRFASLFDASADAAYVVAPSGLIRYWNAAAETLLGRSAEVVVDRLREEALTARWPDDASRERCALALGQKGSWRGELRYPTRENGEIVAEVTVTAVPGKDPDGQVHRLFVVRNITSHRAAQEALAAAEERWRALMESAPEIILEVSLDGHIRYINRSLAGPIEEVLQTTIWQYLRPEKCEEVRRVLEEVRRTGMPGRWDVEAMGPNGTRAWYVTQVSPLKREGTVTGYVLICTDDTLRKDAEDKLRESEARFRALYEMSPVAVPVLTPDGRFLFANHSAQRLLGYPEMDLVGRPLLDLIDEADRKGVRERIDRMTSGLLDSFRAEYRIRHPEGQILWITASFSAVRDPNGNLQHIMATLADNTERIEADRRLRENEARLRAIFESAPIGILIASRERRILYANPMTEQFFGFSLWDLQAMALSELVVEGGEMETILEEVASGKRERATLVNEFRRRGGGRGWGGTSCAGVRDSRGEFEYFVVMIQDLTEARAAQESLSAAHETLQALVEGSPVAIVGLDRDAKVTMWNPAATRLFGWSAEEVLGRFSPTVPEDLKAEGFEIFERVIHGEVVTDLETKRRRKDGSLIDVSISSAPVRDASGDVTGLSAFISDISPRKRVEEELRKAKVAAETASRAKSAFVANMSHEIRTPLGAILGFSEMLLDPGQSEEGRRAAIATIQRNGHHLLTLLDGILDLSKVEAGQFEVQRSRISLAEQITAAVSITQLLASRKDLRLVVKCRGKIPATIDSDATALRQILVNTIGNAIKFTNRGEVRLSVRMRKDRAAPGRNLLQFSVLDTGIGIPPSERIRLFRPFSQLETSGQRNSGAGLGLALSRQLARCLGGDVTLAESVPGRGSVFRVTVDPGNVDGAARLEMAPTGSRPPKPPVPDVPEESLPDGARVLLIEDSEDNRILLRHFLERAGARVDMAVDGLEGVRQAMAIRPDVILMDIQMPRLNGYQATALLRARGIQVPIVALTAHAMREERERCLKAGCDDYLSKPIDPSTLVRVVKRLARPATP